MLLLHVSPNDENKWHENVLKYPRRLFSYIYKDRSKPSDQIVFDHILFSIIQIRKVYQYVWQLIIWNETARRLGPTNSYNKQPIAFH